MGMKYIGAYLMAVISGKDNPTADDVKEILDAGGINYEDKALKEVLKRCEGKEVHEIIAAGLEKFEACGGGGGGAAPAAAAAAPAAGGGGGGAKEEKKVVEEEEEEDMEFDLFD